MLSGLSFLTIRAVSCSITREYSASLKARAEKSDQLAQLAEPYVGNRGGEVQDDRVVSTKADISSSQSRVLTGA
jgi:hypothetical protein